MTITDEALDQALRASDPAAMPLTAAERQAATATLERILATAGDAPSAPIPLRRRTRLRWLAPVAAAVIGAAVLSWPHGDDGVAFASWTATAKPAGTKVSSAAGKGCLQSLEESLAHSSGQDALTGADGYQQVVTEVRGPWVFTALATQDGSSYDCIAEATSPAKVVAGIGAVATGRAAPVPELGTSGFTAQSGGFYEDGRGAFTSAQGQVGSEVVSVVIHADGRDTTATVTHGHFAAWWPIARGSTPATPRYDLVLSDGQVLRNHEPLR